MPQEEEHERPEDMVESPGLAEQAARSLEDAADSHATLEGYEAINNARLPGQVGPDEGGAHQGDKGKRDK